MSASSSTSCAASSPSPSPSPPTIRRNRKRRLTPPSSITLSLLTIVAPVFVPVLPTAHAFITYREVLEPHPHDTSNLPAPLSDLSVAFSMAPVRITRSDSFIHTFLCVK